MSSFDRVVQAIFTLAALITASPAAPPDRSPPRPIDRVVSVRPIQVCDDRGADCAPIGVLPAIEAYANYLYRQAGVRFEFQPIRRYFNSRFTRPSVFVDVDNPEGTPTDEAHQLMREPGHQQSPDPNTLNVWLVDQLATTDHSEALGGTALINGNGAIVVTAAPDFVPDLLAHELGHNLRLHHVDDPDNLMRHCCRTGADILTPKQQEAVREPLYYIAGARITESWCDTNLGSCQFRIEMSGRQLRVVRIRYLSPLSSMFGVVAGPCEVNAGRASLAPLGLEISLRYPAACATDDHSVIALHGNPPFSLEFDFDRSGVSIVPALKTP